LLGYEKNTGGKHIMSSFNYFIKNLANRIGYDIRSLNAKPLRQTMSESYALISTLGFKPKTVIDVGVANGTFELYRAFPDSYFLLIEPLEEFQPHLKSILLKYCGSYVLAAAGSKNEQVDINVHSNHLDGSSLYKETTGTEADGYQRTIQMMRLDDILVQSKLCGPYLIKIDVQGSELDVLDGCPDALKQAEVIVLEVALFEFMIGGPQLHDVILYMKKWGFVAWDIILGWNRPLDNALGQIDIVFVKENGLFRTDHSYTTLSKL
jgi:FkbM family methyltransferase